ncbi:PE-PGRS family protein PE_PGRS33-like [Sycon ciliatum]|uniref:PE-PGRS family protein PE_PGRS33-like n=1 Tax=Sycon ciliatum TaxID=27933 RepID=UPI0031F6D44F
MGLAAAAAASDGGGGHGRRGGDEVIEGGVGVGGVGETGERGGGGGGGRARLGGSGGDGNGDHGDDDADTISLGFAFTYPTDLRSQFGVDGECDVGGVADSREPCGDIDDGWDAGDACCGC